MGHSDETRSDSDQILDENTGAQTAPPEADPAAMAAQLTAAAEEIASLKDQLLRGQAITEALIEQAAELVMAACEPAEDLRGDAEYKTHMAAEMARRSIRDALGRARS